MTRPARAGEFVLIGISGLLAAIAPPVANAHSASDAYLTLTSAQPASTAPYVLHGQWDIAIRDLDFVLHLDDDGDGRVTWGEMRKHRAAIESYAYRYLQVDGGAGNRCTLEPRRQLIDDHADGAYAALFFDAVCARLPRTLSLHYTLFFNIDPSHRGIFVMNNGTAISTALLSPDNAAIQLSR